MRCFILFLLLQAILNTPICAQITEFPVNESTKKISWTEMNQGLDATAETLMSRTRQWSDVFFDNELNILESIGEEGNRIFINGHSKFKISTITHGVPTEYLIRMNYAIRTFSRTGDFRYEITNITFGTDDKPVMIQAEQLFDEWHLQTSIAGAKSLEEKQNLENSMQQYKVNTNIIVDQIIETLMHWIVTGGEPHVE